MVICMRVGVKTVLPFLETKVGIALPTFGKLPINGIRHCPENDTNGWYFWYGETLSTKQNFFSP
ncbi:immunity protein Imm33 domain-containing protein [Catenovulum adriaticum]|uniref:immunity protein Imm33 domain-containing protein n=1 Tax=Catenovulum adriaticum TaxID=2984846 RepID=UPI003D18065E